MNQKLSKKLAIKEVRADKALKQISNEIPNIEINFIVDFSQDDLEKRVKSYNKVSLVFKSGIPIKHVIRDLCLQAKWQCKLIEGKIYVYDHILPDIETPR